MSTVVIALSVIGYIVAYGGLFFWLRSRQVSLKAKPVIRFYEELEKQLDLGVVETLQDVLRIQRSVADEMRSQRLQRRDIKGLLENYLLRATRSDKDAQLVRNRFQFVRQLLAEEPISILPEREQVIAQTLRQNIIDAQPSDALRHLDELVSSIGTRYQALDEQLSRTRWWTIVGAAGAIVGVIIALAMWTLYI